MADRVEEYVQKAPVTQQGTLRRALLGNVSPRMAIKAKCLVCSNFERAEVENCTVRLCPLWAYRPFQGTRGERPPDIEEAAAGAQPNVSSKITDTGNGSTTHAAPEQEAA
jgi:hypothetical protein